MIISIVIAVVCVSWILIKTLRANELLVIVLKKYVANYRFYLPPGVGIWVPLVGPGSTKQFDVFLAYKSKSGSKIVPIGLDPVESITFADNWQVPLPRAEIL